MDDEERFRTNLVKMLTAQGLSVAAAAGGRASVELVEHQPFNVALVDIHLPGMDGLETLAHLKKTRSRPRS